MAERYGCSPSLVEKKLHEKGIETLSAKAAAEEYWKQPQSRVDARKRFIRRVTGRGPISKPSGLEEMFATALLACGVSFRAQVPIGNYIVDFVCEPNVVVEVDGWQHRFAVNAARDTVRDQNLTSLGYKVFRFNGQQIHRDAKACVRWVVDHVSIEKSESPSAEWLSGRGRKRQTPVPKETRERMATQKAYHWKDPVKRETMRSSIQRAQNSPEYRERVSAQRSAFMLSLWSDQGERQKRTEAIRRSRRKGNESGS